MEGGLHKSESPEQLRAAAEEGELKPSDPGFIPSLRNGDPTVQPTAYEKEAAQAIENELERVRQEIAKLGSVEK